MMFFACAWEGAVCCGVRVVSMFVYLLFARPGDGLTTLVCVCVCVCVCAAV